MGWIQLDQERIQYMEESGSVVGWGTMLQAGR
jgi:hypothetical protein